MVYVPEMLLISRRPWSCDCDWQPGASVSVPQGFCIKLPKFVFHTQWSVCCVPNNEHPSQSSSRDRWSCICGITCSVPKPTKQGESFSGLPSYFDCSVTLMWLHKPDLMYYAAVVWVSSGFVCSTTWNSAFSFELLLNAKMLWRTINRKSRGKKDNKTWTELTNP